MVMRYSLSQCKFIKTYPQGRNYLIYGFETSSHDNVKFASSGGDRSVFLWDVTTGTTTRRLSGHSGKINTVAFNEDASVVASGGFSSLLLSRITTDGL